MKHKNDRDVEQRQKRRKYQFLILSICCAKLYSISCLQGFITSFMQDFDLTLYQIRMTALIGVLITGNIVDNLANPRKILLIT